MNAAEVASRVYEWIFRPGAVGAARAALPETVGRRAVAARQAKLLIEAARRIAEPGEVLPPGARPPILLAMYRDAIYWALAARYAAGDPPTDLRALWDATPEATLRAAEPDPEALRDLTKVLFDEYAPRSLAVTDDDVAHARLFAEMLVFALGAPRRRLAWLVAQRWGRIALIGVAVLMIVFGVRALAQGPDLAKNKPFRLSADWQGWADCLAHDGCHGLMLHGEMDNNPWVEIDLGAPKRVQRIDVVNREDCCEDRAVPLIVELSSDRNEWTLVARRNEEFKSWTAKFPPRTARYVRLKVLKRTMLHLRSIAVR